MNIELKVPDSLTHTLTPVQMENLKGFLQAVVNRVFAGGFRYGRVRRSACYLWKLEQELNTYTGRYFALGPEPWILGKLGDDIPPPMKGDGNFEQLLNIAVYCWLESEAPQHPRFHFDNGVESVTREVNR